MSKVLSENTGNTESLSNLQKVLSEEEPPKVEQEEEEELELPVVEEEEEEKEKEGEEEKDSDDEIIEEKVPQITEVNKKYPNFFKDFPSLRHAFFHAKEYREIFSTVEEAKEAAEDVEGLRLLEKTVANGETSDIIGVLDSFKELGTGAVENFASHFLPALLKVDQDTYYATISPIIADTIKQAYSTGNKHNNENLQNAALVLSHFLFGDQKIATGEKELKTKTPEKPQRDEELDRERQEFRNERYTTFFNDVRGTANDRLDDLINDGIDPKSTLTVGMKELITEKVRKEIEKTLGSSRSHSARMDSIWKKAGNDNFSTNWKSKIISAYLEAAGEIMPRIRSSVRASVLGTRVRHSNNDVGERSGKDSRVPKNNAGGGSSGGSTNKIDPKDIDWRKTKDIDFMNDRVTLKKG